jgi:hypothetical protein
MTPLSLPPAATLNQRPSSASASSQHQPRLTDGRLANICPIVTLDEQHLARDLHRAILGAFGRESENDGTQVAVRVTAAILSNGKTSGLAKLLAKEKQKKMGDRDPNLHRPISRGTIKALSPNEPASAEVKQRALSIFRP